MANPTITINESKMPAGAALYAAGFNGPDITVTQNAYYGFTYSNLFNAATVSPTGLGGVGGTDGYRITLGNSGLGGLYIQTGVGVYTAVNGATQLITLRSGGLFIDGVASTSIDQRIYWQGTGVSGLDLNIVAVQAVDKDHPLPGPIANSAWDTSVGSLLDGYSVTAYQVGVDIAFVNSAPTLTASPAGAPQLFTEGGNSTQSTQAGAVAVFTGTAVSTVDSVPQTITSLIFTVSGLVDGASETLMVDGSAITLGGASGGVTTTNGMTYAVAALSGGATTVTLTKVAGVAVGVINTLVNGITYQNTLVDNPTAGDRVFTLTQVKDSGGGTDTTVLNIASTVNVVPVNDVPTIAGNAIFSPVSVGLRYTPDSGLPYSPGVGFAGGNAIVVSDADQAPGATTFTVVVTIAGAPDSDGEFAVIPMGAATVGVDGGLGSPGPSEVFALQSITIVGSLSDVNATLATLEWYYPSDGFGAPGVFDGNAVITFVATDSASGVSSTKTVDVNSSPTVGIALNTPATSPTNADSLVFQATFSEAVSNVNAGDFTVAGTTATITNVAQVGLTPVYNLTVSGGDLAGLNGTVSLGINGATDIVNTAVVLLSTTPTSNASYTVDNVLPLLSSLARLTPLTSPTNANTLIFQATFDTPVTGLDITDFVVSGTTGTVTAVNESASGVWDITVSGGDLATYEGTVTLGFDAVNEDITDIAGNGYAQTGATQTYLEDNTVPTVAIVRNTPASSPTNADSLVFRATFSEAVANVGTADFVASGTTGTVTSVVSAGGNAYDVTVSGGNLAGLTGVVSLGFVGGTDIVDAATNALNQTPTSTETYAVDNTAPLLSSLLKQTPATSPTNVDTLVFRATFNEAVTGLDTADFAVTGTTATVTNVTETSAGSGVWDVTVSGGDLTGTALNATVSLGFAGGQNITDVAGSAYVATGVTQSYVVDNTAPLLLSLNRQTPATSPTNADTLVFRATFDGAVTGLDVTDFVVTGAGASVSAVNETFAGSGIWDLTVSGGTLTTFDGTVTLGFDGANENITDAAGNGYAQTGVTQNYLMANLQPTVAITRLNPLTSPTNAPSASLVFDATFSEAVINVDATDFTVSGTTGTITGISSAGNVYSVTISGGDLALLNGTVSLGINGATNIQNAATNLLNPTPTGTPETYLVDHAAPILTALARLTPSTSPTQADTLIFRATFDTPVTGLDITDFVVTGAGASVTAVTETSAGSGIWDLTVSGGTLATFDGTVTLGFDAVNENITDIADNGYAQTGATQTYVVDNTAPLLSSLNRQTPGTSPTNSDSLVFRATFNEAVTALGTADFVVSGTTATVTAVVETFAGSGIWDVTVSGGDLATYEGTVTLGFDAINENITDLAGIAYADIPTTQTYFLDNTVPTAAIALNTPASSPTNASSLTFSVTFSEAVANVNSGDFTVTGATGVTIMVAAPVGNVYDVTLSAGNLAAFNGTVSLGFAGVTDITDTATNALNQTPTASASYLVDHAAPLLSSLARLTPSTSPTNANTLIFQATFDTPVTGLDITDFVVSGTTGTVTAVNESASGVWDITVSGGDLATYEGTVTLGFDAVNENITDIAGNDYAQTGATQTYFEDNTVPTVAITLNTPASSPTNADTLVFRATFNEAVANVDAADFIVTGGGATTTGTVTNVVSAGGNAYDVTVSGGNLASFNDLVGITIAGATNITDTATNALNQTPTGNAQYLVDNTAPTLTSLNRLTPAGSPTNATSLTFRATFDTVVMGLDATDFVVSGTTATVTSVTDQGAGVWDITVSGGNLNNLEATVTLGFAPAENITDLSSNAYVYSAGATQNYVVDTIAPNPTFQVSSYNPTGTTNTLTLTGTSISSMLSFGGVALGAPLPLTQLDMTKLVWDIDSNGLGGDFSFVNADVFSATVIDANTLQIVLKTATADTAITGLENVANFGISGTSIPDALVISDGFILDPAGNTNDVGPSPITLNILGRFNDDSFGDDGSYSFNFSFDTSVVDDYLGEDIATGLSVAMSPLDTLVISQGISAANVTRDVDGMGNNTITAIGKTVTLDGIVGSLDNTSLRFEDGSVLLTNDSVTSMKLTGDQPVSGSLFSYAHNDQLIAGSGGDVLQGLAGDDLLIGGTGSDSLYGGRDDDILWGQGGNDYLVGGNGIDTFRYTRLAGSDDGHDILSGFRAGAGGDILYFSDILTVDAWALLVSSAVQSGADTLLHFGGESIRLLNVTATSLTNDNFLGNG